MSKVVFADGVNLPTSAFQMSCSRGQGTVLITDNELIQKTKK